MRRSAAVFTAVCLAVAGAAAIPAAAADSFTVRTLHFDVLTGPGGVQRCDIIGDLYTPNTASSSNRVPAILTTNGFGGSKDDQAGLGRFAANNGYVVLSYSGLGFGGSGCKITLDDPDWDGRAASQLVSFLGGSNGIAYEDAEHTKPVAGLDTVIHDRTDHNGQSQPNDPRVGMIGGSYGGGIQFATASVDARVDTLIPLITWNDLSYSLAPNNSSSPTPGAIKMTWAGLFFVDGVVLSGLSGAPNDPERLIGCPNFATWVCPALFVDGVTGYPSTDTLAATKHASVTTFTDRIRIPVFLMQGEHDTLFNLNEGIATYRALKAQGTPVKMLWQSWGHSSLTPPPGEISLSNPDPVAQYQTGRILAWFDHYLKGKPTDTGPEFAYFRDWVPYTGNAAPAYATAPSYPVGTGKRFYLSGNGNLVTDPLALTVGSQSFLTAPAGLPTSFGTLDALGSELPTAFPDTNLPGTFAAWTSGALSSPLSVVGSPTLDVRLIAPTAALTSALGPAGQLVLFAKVYDVAPDGTPSLIKDLVAPIRVADPTRPVQVTLPAFAHRFAPGHQIRVMVAGGDLNYRGGLVDAPVTIATGDTGQALTLPVVPD